MKYFPQLQSLPQVRLKRVLKTVTTASKLLETLLLTFYSMGDQGRKRLTLILQEYPEVMQWYVLISQFPLLFWRCTIYIYWESYPSAQQPNLPRASSHIPSYI